MTDIPTGTVTFLFTDIEGSTRLWEDDPATMERSLASHDEALRGVFDDHSGHVFATGGDGFCVAFARPEQAARAAIAAQQAVGSIDVPFLVRMALHAGVADERDGDYFGPVVNRVARLLEVANGGQVVASGAVAGLIDVSRMDGVTLADLGQHRLRDLASPERIHALHHTSLPRVATAIRTLDTVPNNLPAQVSSFVGRDQELAEAEKLLAGARLLTVTGVGGAGKTRLVIQLAAQLLDDFPDGVWLVELAPVSDPERLTAAVANTLGVVDRADRDLSDVLLDRLRGSSELIVLDNCEHVVDAAAHLADRILQGAPGVKLVATSRELLGVRGEVPFQLRSMAMPSETTPLSEALHHDAVRLFAERAEAVSPGFRITSENLSPVIEIVRRLDGMPLGLELAAARVRVMSAAQIAARLNDTFRLLTGGSRTALPRQQTLEAAIDWSYQLLDDQERNLFRRLSVFQGSFRLESAEEVCGFDPLDSWAVLDLLAKLVDKSLVATVEVGDEVRYRMLETLRQFARERLADEGESDTLGRRHLDHFRKLAETTIYEVRGPDEIRIITGLRADHDNLRRAIRWAIDVGDAEAAQATAGSCYRFWYMDDFLVEGRRWCEEALELAEPAGQAGGRALLGAGTLAMALGDIPEASRHLELAEVLLTEAGDPLSAAARGNYIQTLMATGRTEEAIPMLESQIQGLADETISIISLSNLSVAYHDRGDFENLERVLTDLESRALAAKSMILAVDGFHQIASHRLFLGQLQLSRRACERMVERNEDPCWFSGLSEALTGRILSAEGQPVEGLESFKQGMERFAREPSYQDLASVVRGLLSEWALVFERNRDHEVAAVLLGADDAGYRGEMVRHSYMQARYDEVADRIVGAIGQPAFEAARDRGRTMSFGEAIQYALKS
jgi:predicted ATPase/class 3 adenylate cyclase